MAKDKLLPVVVIHGVGVGDDASRAKFSIQLSKQVEELFRPVYRIGEYEAIKTKPQEKPDDGIYWQEALWESQLDSAENVISKLSLISGLPGGWLKNQIIDLVSDVPLYLAPVTGKKIRKVVRKVIEEYPGCVVAAHSLGTVIATDVLWEMYQKKGREIPVSGLVTFGSPLNLLKMREAMTSPFPFKWHNYFYPNDPIVINDALDKELFKGVMNHELSGSITPVMCHTAYWTSTPIANQIYQLTVKGK